MEFSPSNVGPSGFLRTQILKMTSKIVEKKWQMVYKTKQYFKLEFHIMGFLGSLIPKLTSRIQNGG